MLKYSIKYKRKKTLVEMQTHSSLVIKSNDNPQEKQVDKQNFIF